MKIESDECGDIILPSLNKEQEKLADKIQKILENKHFLHDGWEKYRSYRSDAASFIVKLIEELGYKK